MVTNVALKAHIRSASGLHPLIGEVDSKAWARSAPADFLDVTWIDDSNGEKVRVRKDELETVLVTPEGEVLLAADAEVKPQRVRFKVEGVGPDAETMAHANGAKESKPGFAATSLPPKALLAVAAVQKHGDDKYGVDNWRGISVTDHLNHAQIHYLAFMAGDTQDKHLEHYATRALMALELHLEEKGVVGE